MLLLVYQTTCRLITAHTQVAMAGAGGHARMLLDPSTTSPPPRHEAGFVPPQQLLLRDRQGEQQEHLSAGVPSAFACSIVRMLSGEATSVPAEKLAFSRSCSSLMFACSRWMPRKLR